MTETRLYEPARLSTPPKRDTEVAKSFLSQEHMNPQLTCSQRQWLHSSVGRASHWYCEVTGSNPVEVLNLFQASLCNCMNCVHCDDHFFISKSLLSNCLLADNSGLPFSPLTSRSFKKKKLDHSLSLPLFISNKKMQFSISFFLTWPKIWYCIQCFRLQPFKWPLLVEKEILQLKQ